MRKSTGVKVWRVLKNNKFANLCRRVLDKFTGVKYNDDMLDLQITPKKFSTIKDQYDAALRARQQDILYLARVKGWKQQRIADYYNVDITAINRIIKKAEEREAGGDLDS